MEASIYPPLSHRVSSHSLSLGYIRIPDSSDSDETPTATMKMDLFSRRRNGLSGSAASLSPTVPTLEAPSAFQVSPSRSATADATIRAKTKPECGLAMPSIFQDDNDDADEYNIVNDVIRGAPSDPSTLYLERRSADEGEVSQPQTQHYEESFATRAAGNAPKTRVNKDSIVVVEIKINAKIQNDETLAAAISTSIAHIYQTHENSILVTLQQNACLHFGDKPLPVYFMKVMALPALIAPMTNLRNTILIQSALQVLLNIRADRGVIIYVPIPEENFATNGVTAMGEIRSLERPAQSGDSGFLKSISRSMSKRLKSSGSSSRPLSQATTSSWSNTPEGETTDRPPVADVRSQSSSKEEEEGPRSVKRSRSVRQFLSRRLSDLGRLGEMH